MNAQAPGGADPKFKDRDILVIEDEELIASVLEEMLIDLGCRQIWVAATVKEATAVLAEHRPHAAVLDINLGGDSGFQLAQTLADAKVPFVFATGYGRHALPEEWAARPVIQKPFRFETLATVLGAVL